MVRPPSPILVPLVRASYLCLALRGQPGQRMSCLVWFPVSTTATLPSLRIVGCIGVPASAHWGSTRRSKAEARACSRHRLLLATAAVHAAFSLQAFRHFVLGALASSEPDLAGLPGHRGAQAARSKHSLGGIERRHSGSGDSWTRCETLFPPVLIQACTAAKWTFSGQSRRRISACWAATGVCSTGMRARTAMPPDKGTDFAKGVKILEAVNREAP